MASWEEIDAAIEDGRHELHLTGDSISQKLKTTMQLPEKLFSMSALNYLEIADTTLNNISPKISQLDILINLALHRNEITHIPNSINELKKLKFLDISFNKIASLPETLDLPLLHTLNMGNNLLTSLPDLSGLQALGVLHIDHNNLTELPTGFDKLTNLSEVGAAKNEVTYIPESVTHMVALKNLNLSENQIKEISVDLSLCKKMKDLNIKDNPLKDNRLRKMTIQCSTKAILDYISQHASGDGKKSGKGKKGKKKKEIVDADDGKDEDVPKIYVIQPKDSCSRQVITKASVKEVRPYICCMVVKDLDLSDPAVFKKFIALQTKLHENECDMRTKATIATHNASTLQFPLTYEAVSPDGMVIAPLGKSKKCSPKTLIESLKSERDTLKLKKKRQPKTGLYKFIELVDGKDQYACVRNDGGEVVSFPPVTNSELTKICSAVADVFIEVTSPLSLPQCKYVMEELVKQMYNMEMVSKCDNKHGLVLEKVSVIDEEGNLRVVFPSKVDLEFKSAIPVDRIEQL